MQYIYLIRSQQFLKIGIASNPGARILELQVGNPIKLELVACCEVKNPNTVEWTLHQKFLKKRVSGEWFILVTIYLSHLNQKGTNMRPKVTLLMIDMVEAIAPNGVKRTLTRETAESELKLAREYTEGEQDPNIREMAYEQIEYYETCLKVMDKHRLEGGEDDDLFCGKHQCPKNLVDYEDGSRYECPECQRERGEALGLR